MKDNLKYLYLIYDKWLGEVGIGITPFDTCLCIGDMVEYKTIDGGPFKGVIIHCELINSKSSDVLKTYKEILGKDLYWKIDSVIKKKKIVY